MTDWPRFPKAPIAEAILDVSVVLPPSSDLQRIRSLQEALGGQYPKVTERMPFHGGFEITSAGVTVSTSSGRPDGYLFTSSDDLQTIQARLDGFGFSRMKPYEHWSAFRAEAKRQWEKYRDLLQPKSITRIGLRYLNRLELPLPVNDLRKYVRNTPELAPDLPQVLTGFFMAVQLPVDASFAVITETIEPATPAILPFILDIAVHREGQFDSDSMWDVFDELRELKNRIFFHSVTDHAKEMFR